MDEGADVEADGVDVEGVAVDSCRCCGVDEFEPDVLGEDCAKAEVAIATAAVVVKNKRLFI